MIVKCNAIYNQNTNHYLDVDPFNHLIVGYHYNILEVHRPKPTIHLHQMPC